MPVDSLQIGLKVQALRKSTNLTQEKLAEYINVSWRSISNLERGMVIPTLQLIYDLAQYFDISIDELLDTRITKNKSVTRIRRESKVIESICELDDRMFAHIEEYVVLLRKHFS